MRGHILKFSMWSVLVIENQLVEQAVHVWLEETGSRSGGTHRFRIGRLNGSSYQLFDLSREVLEEPLNDGTVSSLVGWAKHEIDGVVGAASREDAGQVLQTVRMVCPGIVQKQLQWNAVTRPLLLDSKIEM